MCSGAYSVGFPWLPVLGQYLHRQQLLEEGLELSGDVPSLASPTLEQLYFTDDAQTAIKGRPYTEAAGTNHAVSSFVSQHIFWPRYPTPLIQIFKVMQ